VALYESGRQVGPAGLAEALGVTTKDAIALVTQLLRDSKIMRAGGDKYKAAPA
jgi:hypothetical protein